MGGVVGLKGTDGTTILQEAVRSGAIPVSPKRAKEFLSILPKNPGISLVVAEGGMGADIARELGVEFVSVNGVGVETTRTETVRIPRSMLKQRKEVLAFAGAAGTDREVWDSVGEV